MKHFSQIFIQLKFNLLTVKLCAQIYRYDCKILIYNFVFTTCEQCLRRYFIRPNKKQLKI